MRVTMSAIFFLIAILFLSIFVANVANLIATDADRDVPDDDPGNNLPRKQLKKYDIGDSKDHLMWFLQISDIHISIFTDPSRITQMKEFCDITVDTFNPHVVLASGDLTDAKTKDAMGSKQYLNEWKHYKRILDESGVTKKTVWLDVRGNHDNFNVMHIKSPDNYYLNYSVQGPKYSRSYAHHIQAGNEKYSFIAVDACLEPGPRRPFNFVGILTNNEIDKIKKLVDESKKLDTDYTVWFGHYPTSAILSKYKNGIREIIARHDKAMAYLCGHYHTLGGLSPEMYTLQRGGYLELELADWKDNRMFRLGVIDHGQFSFIDVKYGTWPVVLITNPKHALYAMPSRENIQSIIDSTHIRVLAYSTISIKKVSIKINENSWVDCNHIDGPLYVAKWNTSLYRKGIHHIYAKVIDDYDRIKETVQPFSLDGTRLSFRIFPRFILMSDASSIFAVSFGVMLMINVLPLCFLRIYHKFCLTKRIKRPHLPIKCLQILLRKFWILSTIDWIFYPMVIYPLYLVIGPWAAGEVIENQFGWVFAWGIYIGDSYLPGSFTYAYGFVQLFTFHMPLNFILAYIVDRRFQWMEKPPQKQPTMFLLLWRNLAFFLLISMQTSMAYFFWLAYGTVATVFCPLRTWSIIMALILWYHANRLQNNHLRSAAFVWRLTKQYSIND